MRSRKLISLLCAFSMVGMLFTSFATVNAAERPSMKATIVESTYEVGDTIHVEISYADVPGLSDTITSKLGKYTGTGIQNMQYIATFDPSQVEIQDFVVGSDYSHAPGYNEGTSQIIGAVTKQVATEYYTADKNSGVLLTMEFVVLDDSKPIDVTLSDCAIKVNSYDNSTTATTTIYYGKYSGEEDTMDVVGTYEPAPAITVKSVNVKPATTTVAGEAQETFTAEVIGSDDNPYSDQNVTWSATAGTITDEGVFTAPAATDKDQTITITATSDADDSVSGTATVTVPAAAPVEQDPTTDITANNGTGGVYFDVTMNGNGESITDANVVVAGPTADGEGKEVTFKVINYGDIQGELSFIIGILTDIAGDYTGTSNVTTGVGTATDSATVAFPAAQ